MSNLPELISAVFYWGWMDDPLVRVLAGARVDVLGYEKEKWCARTESNCRPSGS